MLVLAKYFFCLTSLIIMFCMVANHEDAEYIPEKEGWMERLEKKSSIIGVYMSMAIGMLYITLVLLQEQNSFFGFRKIMLFSGTLLAIFSFIYTEKGPNFYIYNRTIAGALKVIWIGTAIITFLYNVFYRLLT